MELEFIKLEFYRSIYKYEEELKNQIGSQNWRKNLEKQNRDLEKQRKNLEKHI